LIMSKNDPSCVCGAKKSEHIKIIIKAGGVDTHTTGKGLKCPHHVGNFKENNNAKKRRPRRSK